MVWARSLAAPSTDTHASGCVVEEGELAGDRVTGLAAAVVGVVQLGETQSIG